MNRGSSRLSVLLPFVALAACGAPPSPDSLSDAPPLTQVERADWKAAFETRGAVGTFVLFDPETGSTQRYDPERAAARFTPASTSKLFNSLVFLDQGIVGDVDSLHAWDGVERWRDSWNQDLSLRTGVDQSAVWLFQRLASQVGPSGYADAFARYRYGNATMGDTLHMAWLNGAWQVSADEQIAFLDGLRLSDLPFSAAYQATVRDLMPLLDEGDAWRLKGKTGWGQCCARPDIGWIVGWLERPGGPLLYAMNVEAAPGSAFDMGPGRLNIVRAILASEGLLSSDAQR